MSFRERFESKNLLGERKIFQHTQLNLPKLERIDSPTGRRYVTPEGVAYPSVTTILDAVGDKEWLQEWKDRIGENEATRITKQSGRRGTELHNIAERYVLNEENYLRDPTPVYYDLWRQVKPLIDENVESVYGTELGLYSDLLKAAGTTDLAAVVNGVNSIVDYKNARYVKKLEDIEGYWAQTCMYAIMLEERTGISFPQLVIFMAVEGNEKGIPYFQPTKKYVPQVAKILKEYYRVNS